MSAIKEIKRNVERLGYCLSETLVTKATSGMHEPEAAESRKYWESAGAEYLSNIGCCDPQARQFAEGCLYRDRYLDQLAALLPGGEKPQPGLSLFWPLRQFEKKIFYEINASQEIERYMTDARATEVATQPKFEAQILTQKALWAILRQTAEEQEWRRHDDDKLVKSISGRVSAMVEMNLGARYLRGVLPIQLGVVWDDGSINWMKPEQVLPGWSWYSRYQNTTELRHCVRANLTIIELIAQHYGGQERAREVTS